MFTMTLCMVSFSSAQAKNSTLEQAKAHAQKAAAFVQEHGKEAALVEFNKKDSQFIQDDLYVFVVNQEGEFIAHPIKPALVGKNAMEMKDPDGTFFIKRFVAVEDEGWVSYKWSHPVSNEVLPKKSYIVNLDGFYLGVGVYHQSADSTLEQAKAHAEEAANFIREHGSELALEEFNKKEGQFVKDDLYVFVVDKEGAFLAHPIKPALVGKNMMVLKDIDGTPFIKQFTEVEKAAWVPYKWPHPVSKKIQPKKSYIINVDGFILGVGAHYIE